MAVSTAQATAMLGALPGTLYIQAHSGDPGAAGTANTIPGTIRGAFSLPLAAGGQRAKVTNVDLPAIPAAAVVSHVSYWDGPVGSGSFLFSEPLGVTVTFLYQGTLRFTSQVFTITTETGGSQTSTSVIADYAAATETATGRLLVVNTDATTQTDVTAAYTGTGASDASSQSDANAIRLGVVVSDSTSQADTAARGGAVSDVTDTTTAVDSHTLAQTLRSSATDTAGQIDSDTASVEAASTGSISAPRAGAQNMYGSAPYPTGVVAGTTLLLVGTNLDTATLVADGWTQYSDPSATMFVLVKRAAGALSGSLSVPALVDGEGLPYDSDAKLFAWDGVAVSPFTAHDSVPTSAGTGTTVTGTSGMSISAGDVMILVDFATSRKAATAASGSIDSFIAGDPAGVVAALNLGYQSTPVSSGVQAAPVLTVSASTAHYQWTAALKKA